MSKRYTVDETWELCLKMWKWIDWHIARGTSLSVSELKDKWMRKNGFLTTSSNCFFCDYAIKAANRAGSLSDCDYCPIYKVNHDLGCSGPGYDFDQTPRKFYRKIVELNKIRFAKK